MLRVSFFILALACVGLCVKEYKTPVVFMHGLTGSEKDGAILAKYIEVEHPGQPFYSLPVDCGEQSYKNLYQQIQDVQVVIQTLIDTYPDQFANGFHLIGHSQGGLLTRCVVEESDRFNIRNYISLAGVQAGEYGHCEVFGSGDCNALTAQLYSPEYRNLTSVANFWRSPNPTQFMNGNVFLPVMFNLVNPDPRRKANMLRLKHMYLFGSDGDEIISPWQSSLLGFFDADGTTVLPLEKQEYYIQDTFGLRTLKESNRLTLTSLPGRSHGDWLLQQDIIEQYILPCLED